MFWTPNGFNELPEVRFEFPFNLIGDLGTQLEVQNKDFGAVSQRELTRVKFRLRAG